MQPAGPHHWDKPHAHTHTHIEHAIELCVLNKCYEFWPLVFWLKPDGAAFFCFGSSSSVNFDWWLRRLYGVCIICICILTCCKPKRKQISPQLVCVRCSSWIYYRSRCKTRALHIHSHKAAACLRLDYRERFASAINTTTTSYPVYAFTMHRTSQYRTRTQQLMITLSRCGGVEDFADGTHIYI